jgi:hypothetical protein
VRLSSWRESYSSVIQAKDIARHERERAVRQQLIARGAYDVSVCCLSKCMHAGPMVM